MRKIKYPYQANDALEKNKFLDSYFDAISSKINDKDKICLEIKKIDSNWDLKKLLTADFHLLLEFVKKTGTGSVCLNDLFKTEDGKINLYKDLQRSIADFLIEKKLNLKTCYYCNIDFINPFNHFIQYEKVEDFIKYATKSEWIELTTYNKGVSIYNYIKKNPNVIINDLLTCKIPKVGKTTIQKIEISKINNLKKNKDHFTLDHILPKSKYPYLSISLFNLIPSCYSCNSKFKRNKEFKDLEFIHKISPSSKTFELDKLLKFKLNFDVNTIDFENSISKIKLIDDVKAKLTNLTSEKEVDIFIDMFSLKGRYEFHNGIAEEMVEKRRKYSDTQIKEIAKLLSVSKNQVKRDLFGNELFEETNAPFEKYKKDIAKQLGLLDYEL